MRQGDGQGLGQSTASGPTSSAQTMRCSGVPATAAPAVGADGTLFQPSTAGTLFALSGKDGSLVWTFTPPSPPPAGSNATWPSITPALAASGDLIFHAADALYALDTSTGEVTWSWNPSLTAASFSVILTAGTSVFAVMNNNAVVALDASGDVTWLRLGSLNDISLSPDEATLYVVSTSSPPALFSLDATDGSVQWTQPWAGPLAGAPLVTSTGQLVLTSGMNYTLFDPNSRTVVWSVQANPATPCSPAGAGVLTVSQPALIMGATLIATWFCNAPPQSSTASNGLFAFTLVSGSPVWATQGVPANILPGWKVLPPVAGADPTVYSASLNGTISGTNSGTGALIWAINGASANAAPFGAIAPGKLLALGNCLYAEAG